MGLRALCTVLLLFLLAYRGFALDPSLEINQYAHTALKVRDGFGKGFFRSIAQTPDGYLWLGTDFGLLRFDGVRPLSWQPPSGQRLPGINIPSLLVTRDGALWIGTANGLARWKDGRLTTWDEFSGQHISSLLQDRAGAVWIGSRIVGTGAGKLCAFQNEIIQCYDDIFRSAVSSLYEDSEGNLWVGVNDGFWKWKPGRSAFFAFPEDPVERSIGEDSQSAILFGTQAGIFRLTNGQVEPYPLPGLPQRFRASRILRDRDGGLWIATLDRGLVHYYQGRTDVFSEADGLSGDSVADVFEDREGNVWAATTNGLDRFRGYAAPRIGSKQGLSNSVIESLLAAKDGSLWIATFNGLNRWKDGRISVFGSGGGTPQRGGKFDELTHCLFEDSRGRIWVSTSRQTGYIENGRFVPVLYFRDSWVYSMAEAPSGHIWVANDPKGLFHFFEGRVVENIPWAVLGHKDYARVLLADPSQRGLWVGFSQGGVVHFANGRIQESYSAAEGLGLGMVNGLRFGADGVLWAATAGGLSRIKDGHIATLTSNNGFPCNTVHWSVEDDHHSFWVYTACGLVRIARPELDAWIADPARSVTATLFDETDGVRSGSYPSQLYGVTKSSDGRIWFAGFDGVSFIDPHRLALNNLAPAVHIQQMLGDGKKYDIARGLRLPPLVRDLAFDFAALSLVDPERNRYRVKLEGWDSDWRDTVHEFRVEYTNLPPRSYRFRVIASNNSGVWNETGDTLEFSIAPAFYQTNWFRALLAAAILAILGVGYQLRVWGVQRESRRLRDVIETIPAYVWSAQPDGSVDFVNRRWLEFSGFSLDKAFGWGWADALHPEDRARLVEQWQAAVASGNALEAEARMRGADGQYRWLLFRSVPQRDRSGRILKWYGKSMDITELKRAEEERKRMHELEVDLAHMNRVSIMGELSASIAHEVNQPLTGIVNNGSAGLRWLTGDAPDLEEAREAFRRVVRDGKRAGEIIARIRALTRRTPPPREKLDLNETILEVVAVVGDEAKKNSVTIRTQFADQVSPVHGDRVQLQQVLLNLVMNAIHAMSNVSDRERRLVIVTQNIDQQQVQVTVEDSGTGLDPDQLPKIFEPFYTTKSGGMGMGLSICRSILQAHGGQLWATANEGPGARFHFVLAKWKGEETKAAAG